MSVIKKAIERLEDFIMKKKFRIAISKILVMVLVLNILCSVFYSENIYTNGNIIANAEPLTSENESILPYSYHRISFAEENINMSGITVKDAVIFQMGYNGTSNGHFSQVDYNFKGKYKSITFDAGFYSGAQRNANLTIIADGNTIYNQVEISSKSAAKSYTIDLTGIHQLTIKFESSGYDTAKYAIGNIVLKAIPSLDFVEYKVSNMLYNCEPYYLKNASIVSEQFDMGGYTYYDGGINLRMGYNGTSSGGTSTVMFNFQGHYRSISFDIARFGGSASRLSDARMSIKADGVTIYDSEVISWSGIPKTYTIDLTGVTELEIFTESGGYDTLNFRMGNIRLVSDGIVRGITFKKSKVTVTSDSPTVQLEPVVIPNDAVNQNYTLETNSSITALVDDNGLVTGRHRGTAIITATTEEGGFETTCTVESNLPAAKYVPSIHGWGVRNLDQLCVGIFEYDYDGDIHVSDYYEKLYQRIVSHYTLYEFDSIREMPSGPAFLYYTYCGATAEYGMCYGLSLSSALTYTGDLPFSLWSEWGNQNPSNPGEVSELNENEGYSNKLDMYLKQMIFACHMSQANPQALWKKQTNINQLNELIAAVKNFQNTGKNPIILHLIKNGCNHVLIPYEVYENEDVIEIYVYNCVLDEEPDDDKIIFKKDASGKIISWSYRNYSNNDTKLSFEDDLSKVADRLKNSNIYDKLLKVISTSAKSYSVVKGTEVLATYSYNEFDVQEKQETIVPVFVRGDSSVLDVSAICQMTEDEITIINNDSAESVQTLLAYESSAICVDSDGHSEITSATDDNYHTIKVKPSKNGKVSVRYNYGENDGIILTGDTEGVLTVEISKEDNEVSFVGFNSVQVTLIDDGAEKVGNIITINPNVKYTVSENGELICEVSSKSGDVNSDNMINAMDALLVLKHAASISILYDEKLLLADVNSDNSINAVDALIILKFAANIIDEI